LVPHASLTLNLDRSTAGLGIFDEPIFRFRSVQRGTVVLLWFGEKVANAGASVLLRFTSLLLRFSILLID
jgi:hypothetical protein